ncbi:MAG: hypothetical protein HRT69_10900 [Flavobacteriaceae bacterium]|nr:hypothetical protein [Flavobacteriaceae bacterium]
MLFSKNNFFKPASGETKAQTNARLDAKRLDVLEYLRIKGIPKFWKQLVLDAYDYFEQHPNEFDGASIVKDLDDLPNLSLAAMVHDYLYLIELKKNKGWRWLYGKCIYDYWYGKLLEMFGKGIFTPYFRTVLLVLSTPFYWLLLAIKKKQN